MSPLLEEIQIMGERDMDQIQADSRDSMGPGGIAGSAIGTAGMSPLEEEIQMMGQEAMGQIQADSKRAYEEMLMGTGAAGF